MLPAHQPANVGEEEAPVGIVRVSVRVRVLVVLSVVTDPHPETVLAGQCVHIEQEDPNPLVRLEGPVRKEAMSPHGDALARGIEDPECW